MTKKRIVFPAFLLPAALCLLVGSADVAHAECNFAETIELVLEEILLDGEPVDSPFIGSEAELVGPRALVFQFYGEGWESFDHCSGIYFRPEGW